MSLYRPIVAENQYKKAYLAGFVKESFDYSFKQMVNFFVEQEKLSPGELKEIISIIERGKKG